MLRHNTKRARLLWSLNYCGWEQGHGEPGYVHVMCGINEPVLQGVCDLPVNDIHKHVLIIGVVCIILYTPYDTFLA